MQYNFLLASGALAEPLMELLSSAELVEKHWRQQSIRTYMFPLMKIWQVYATAHVDMTPRLDLHVSGRFDVNHWWIVWMSVQQPQADWNVVRTT